MKKIVNFLLFLAVFIGANASQINNTIWQDVDEEIVDTHQEDQVVTVIESEEIGTASEQEDVNTSEDDPLEQTQEDKQSVTKNSSSQSTKHVSVEQNNERKSHSPQVSTEDIVTFALYLIIPLIIYKVIRFYTKRKCFKCGKAWAMKVVDETMCGTVKTETKRRPDKTLETIYHNRYQTTRQCKHCGHRVVYTEVRRES